MWLRRSTALVALPALAAFALIVPWGRRGWELDWDWGMRTAATGMVFLAPIIAGLAAYDMSHRFRASLFDIAGGSRRGPRSVMFPALATWAWAMTACAAGWAWVAVSVTFRSGMGPRDGWVYPESATAMLAAAAIGGFLGAVIRGVLAAPTAAIAVYCVGFFTEPYGVRGVLSVVSSSGTLLGLERTPERAVQAIVINGLLALVFLVWTVWRSSPFPQWRLATTGAGALAIIALAVAFVMPPSDSEYRASSEPNVCVGQAPQVCGPEGARRLLLPVQADLQGGRTRLAGTGLVWPATYVVARVDKVFQVPPGAAVLELTPDDVRDGHYRVQRLAAALSQPRLCAAFFDDKAVQPYVEASVRLRDWLTKALSSTKAPGPAPESIKRDFALLSKCQQALAAP